MLDVNMCRLCLNKDNLLDVFYSRKSCRGTNHLRTCILLCTGVNILPEDEVTKYVCRKCCDLSLVLFQFRQAALANERTLKHINQYISSNLPVDIDEIVELNELLLKNRDLTLRRYGRDQFRNLSEPEEENYAVHPSVVNIIRTYENIVLPDKVLKLDLNPTVLLDSDWENFDCHPPSDNEDTNGAYSNSPLGHSDAATETDDFEATSMDLLEVVREQTVVTRPPQTKKRKLVRKGGNRNKRLKRNGVKIPALTDKFLSLTVDNIASYTSDTHKRISETFFFQPDELSFLEDLFTRYEDSIQSDQKQTVSVGVNTVISASTPLRHSIETKNGTCIISSSSECLNYRIPVICQYNEGVTTLKIIANDKDLEPVTIRLWDVDKVISFNRKTEQC